ncbi:hypothetical protein [Streptomyces sp. NPDC047028]|uniref:hypothetical protein n=1 Tax=Streptomyces sp. NPDC047028 TaxID=3155793 RepID=UPI0033E069E4
MSKPKPDLGEALAQHIADQPFSAVQRALRILGWPIRFELVDVNPTTEPEQGAPVDWQAIAKQRERELKTVGNARHRAEAAIMRVLGLVRGLAHPTSAGISDYDLGRHELAVNVVAALSELSAEATEGEPSALREQIADAIARNNLPMWPKAAAYEAADAALSVVLPHSRAAAALYRSAEDTVTRVIDLYERWKQAGGPPLGTSMSRYLRWWDEHLAELHNAIQPADQTTEK